MRLAGTGKIAGGTKRRKSAAVTPKRVTDERFYSATVGVGESNIRVGAREVHSSDCLARNTQWVHVCVNRNATACTSAALRLYTSARDSGGMKCVRPLSRKRREQIRDARIVGRKAAMFAEGADDVVEVADHPILDLLHKPNPFQSGSEFMFHMWSSLWLTGNRYWSIVEARGGGIESLYPMQPQFTRIIPSRETFIAGYVYGRSGAIEDVFMPDEVRHAKLWPNLHSPYYGGCPLHAIRGEVDLDQADLENETANNRNGARPDWILEAPENAQRADIEALEARINMNHRGPKNRGKLLITTCTNPKSVQFMPKDMEAVLSRQDRRTIIWAAFGIPESEVKVNSANLASSVTGNDQYLRQTIGANIAVQAEVMTAQLLPYYDIEPGEMWLAYDSPAQRDSAAESTILVSLVGSGIITRDEARAELGYEPLPDGAGETGGPMTPPEDPNAVTTEQAGSGKQDQQGGKDEKRAGLCPRPGSSGGVHGGGEVSGERSQADQKGTGNVRRKDKGDSAGVVPDPDKKKVTALRLVVEEYLAGEAVAIAIGDNGVVTLTGIEIGRVSGSQFIAGENIPLDLVTNVVAAVRPVVRSIYTDGVQSALESIGQSLERVPPPSPAAVTAETPPAVGVISGTVEVAEPLGSYPNAPIDPYVLPEQTLHALEQHTIRLAKETSAETLDIIKTSLAEGITSGDTMPMLTERVARSLGETAPYRSERIARTESVRATTMGNIEGWRSAGVTHKQWLLSTDPCPICVALAEKFNEPVSIDHVFLKVGESVTLPDGKIHTNDYLPMHGPPGHPNCRCGLQAVEAPQ